MMNLKEISKKIIGGDFSSLLRFVNSNRKVHPMEAAKILTSVPLDAAVDGFRSLPTTMQTKVFPYVDFLVQQKSHKGIDKAKGCFYFKQT